jgi:geranylgeranyl pyrophosphate synthase
MDIYDQALKDWNTLSHSQEWPEMQRLFQRAVAKKPHDWQLPVFACEAVGGTSEQAVPAVIAMACMQIGIILVDDMLDDDPRGEYHRIGTGGASNLALAFQSAGLEAIARSDIAPSVKLAALENLNQMMLTTSLGQYWDAKNPADESAYWQLVHTKSAPFFRSALCIGALLGGATQTEAAAFDYFGELYGEMIQIHDDLNDTMAIPASPDWSQGRSPLPILFAQIVDYTERARFLALRQDVSDVTRLAEAQAILIRCGAVSYCVDQIVQRHHLAKKMLADLSLKKAEGLENLLDGLIHPIREMFTALGMTYLSSESLIGSSE